MYISPPDLENDASDALETTKVEKKVHNFNQVKLKSQGMILQLTLNQVDNFINELDLDLLDKLSNDLIENFTRAETLATTDPVGHTEKSQKRKVDLETFQAFTTLVKARKHQVEIITELKSEKLQEETILDVINSLL